MKNRIFIYLFIFAILFILYQYTSSSNYFKTLETDLKAKDNQITVLKDSIEGLFIEKLDLKYFDLESNDDALVYFDDLGIQDISLYISDKLLETNESEGDNPLVPYAGTSGKSMKINKIKMLNHRWIIADFSDGTYWGELLIGYEIKEDKSVSFTLKDHLLYTRSEY